jgi:supervillin
LCNQSRLRTVQEQLQTLERKFSVESLRARPVPNGVDPVRLETYLTDNDFEAVFGMSREAFYRLPGWKQTQAKQVAGLY